ncbi:glucosyl transferase [Methanocella sp. CWC-04]|uniref:Glucosyl transferase n=1 Tax=Methanooceanicella nereidis TaxID=2052831 RepID=A0AAP2W8J3_9EURY|nr:glycosyltransferase [Methanocella sp. CWC-04]MCD1296096.1 glucosyl transferase [Methanocella sp. CWC-04]
MRQSLSGVTTIPSYKRQENIGEEKRADRPIKVSVVIPTMNEPAIGRVIEETRQGLKHFEVEIIVVDKSEDDTARRALKAGAIVVHQESVGYGDAYITGFRQVSLDSDIVVMMDGDYTYDPFEIPLLLEPITKGSADIVLGNRFARIEEGAMTGRNRLGNKIITGSINLLYRLRLKDSQTGFRAIRASSMHVLEVTSEGMPFASEMIIDSMKKSLKVVEVPIRYRQRIGDPKLKAYKDGSQILGLVIRMVRDYNPLTIFLPAGALLIVLGTILGSSVVYEWLTTGLVTRLASTVLSAFLIIAGLQIVFFGLLADIILVALRSRH